MKNRKQLLADFYLDLLALPLCDLSLNQKLHYFVRQALAKELDTDEATIKRIFTRMASEDNPTHCPPKPAINPNYCPQCDKEFTNIGDYARHKCFMEEFK